MNPSSPNFDHGGQSQRRSAEYAGDIVHKCVRITQVHSLLLHSHSPVRRQSDMTGERSGEGPTALRAFRGTGVSHRPLPDSELRLSNFFLRWKNPVTIILARPGIRTQDLSAAVVLVPCTLTTTPPRQSTKP
ncbi:hypothetical protein O3G_MSEX014395 [Manduca sexta]|uniref:Uncharacterized protein n=1 Tax=Manduca sexta TaxID=7130 RepID=A0A921ZUA0_MANSE|nr:hypothetical protein O3G_MSEX014395 [Manduca sexta]